MYIFYGPVYYDHAAIVAVTVVDGTIIMVAIVNTVPVAAAIAKSHRFSHCHFYLIVVCSRRRRCHRRRRHNVHFFCCRF